ncbi:restriction endonuclease subunit S [Pseudomonas sp. BT-42-2]|uniref:restriction endonuclease subunit S n=1 Tax=Pseudomonas sp. BT-42-2 TaxID=2986927 RepID=UPI0021F71977|nr:restriction endonuclease subunit S [Pseudomonas sp. BT-42-2]MCV9921580.1 restriction endonuclease subunit S [Pseudomonas sp. BT-42-2]
MNYQTAARFPRIRFKGFNAAWEKKPLGTLYTERNERGNDSLPILSVSIHSGVSTGELSGEALGKKVRRSEDKSLYKHVYAGDLVLNMMRAWQGALGVAKIEGMVSPAYLTATPGETIFPLFMDYGLRRPQIVAQMNNLSYGVTDFRKRLYWDSFVRIEFDTPSVSEQRKIATYFRDLESTIAFHQRKHEKLVALKKAMLQKMFPKLGAVTPEVRFGEFSKRWEKKMLGAVGIFNPREKLPEVFEYVDLESVVGTEMVGHRRETRRTAPSRAQRLARKGDLFFQTVRPYQKNNHLFTLSDENYVFSTGYAQIRPHGDGNFLLSLMQCDDFVAMVLANCTGTSYPAISANTLSGIPVLIPSPGEQEKIGSYFRNLDALIVKHAAQIRKLQQIKLACLDEMFV